MAAGLPPPDLEHLDCRLLLRIAGARKPDWSGGNRAWIPRAEGVRLEHIRDAAKFLDELIVGESVAALSRRGHPAVRGEQMLNASKIGTELAPAVHQP